MDEQEKLFRRDRKTRDRPEYHGDMKCLDPGHHTAISVDVIETINDGRGGRIRLAIWDDVDDRDPQGLTDLGRVQLGPRAAHGR